VFLSEFSPSNKTVTELSEIENGFGPVSTTFESTIETSDLWTETREAPEVPNIRKTETGKTPESAPLHVSLASATVTDPVSRLQASVMDPWTGYIGELHFAVSFIEASVTGIHRRAGPERQVFGAQSILPARDPGDEPDTVEYFVSAQIN
jgi:hypothetical protein